MRPARRVLLYAFGPVERGALAHLLRVRGYRVAEALTPEDAVAIAADGSQDLHGVLVRQWHPNDGAIEVVKELVSLATLQRVMFVGNAQREARSGSFRPHIWLGAEASNAEILEALRILVQRKRGPRRKIPAKTEVAS